jgi:aryl-alcohol dehydrogenase-like predicted oxidoreductase
MRYRPLGRTGVDISPCTLGTWGLRRGASDAGEMGKAWAMAIDRGINAIEVDAAAGIAEPIQRLLAEDRARDRVHVLARIRSLVPFDLPSPHIPAHQAYPGAHIRAESEALLKALGVERLGLLLLPDWCPEWWHEGDWLPTLASLKDQGKIAGFGVSLFDHDVEAALEGVARGMVDAVQVMYNIFDPQASAALLPLCLRHNVGVIARSPLYYGMLVPRDDRPAAFPVDDWRSEFFFDAHLDETRRRADHLETLAEQSGNSLADLALRFSLSHPAISTVAVGMSSRVHLDADLAALERGQLGGDELRAVSRHKWLC